MQQLNLSNNVKFILKDNVLAVLSNKELATVSSAIFNGGFQKVKAVLNMSVPEGYSDRFLHMDPFQLITSSAAELDLTKDYLAMVTAARVKNYSLVSKKDDGFSVTVIATAGCSHGESSGEDIVVTEIIGTINIIVFIDGNPTDSCMAASLITATEAKTAALRSYDVRSRYTGDSATGSITDSVTVASTKQGDPVSYGGPASKLGKIVGYCTRRAVSEALIKQEPEWTCRTVLDRLKERHLPITKLVYELSRVKGIKVTEESLPKILNSKPVYSAFLLAAVKLDDDLTNGLVPIGFGNVNAQSKSFASCLTSSNDRQDYDNVDLPAFTKQTLIAIIKEAASSV